MSRIASLALAASLAGASGAFAQADAGRYTDRDPRVDAQIRTAAGETLGTVERLRFETAAHAVIDGYVVEYGGALEVGGREVCIDADRTSWSGRPMSPVLEIEYTREELDALPDFDEDLATAYPLADNEWFVGEGDGEEIDPDAMSDASEETGLGDRPERAGPRDMWDERVADDAAEEHITWDSTFNPDLFTREDWMNQEVFTSSGDELGVVTGLRPESGTPAALVVTPEPTFQSLGDTVEIEIAQVTGVAERERAIRVNMAVITRNTGPDTGP